MSTELNALLAAATEEAPVSALKPAVDPATLTWRAPRRDAFWQQIPAWRDVDHETFGSFLWQEKHAITTTKRLFESVRELVDDAFVRDVEQGFAHAPMTVRISPYLLSLIDWSDPHGDPIRRQFLPLASDLEADHPMLTLDSLGEQADAPVPGLTHRYPDKALFLALDTCPVYCRFCTRSYAVGLDTDKIEKVQIKANRERWARAFRYLTERPEIEDVVVSGGDAYRIKADQLLEIGHALLDIPHIRRFRVATKGLAVLPMRIKAGDDWTEAVTALNERARKLGKDMAVHTHFGHANEITGFSEDMMRVFQERGVLVRNQAVLQRGVNDSDDAMLQLTRKLGYVNIHPYYVYVCDMVRGVENLRTTVDTAIRLEKRLRGSTAGFNTPSFIVDAMGGGGKRDAHSFEHYDRRTGIAVYQAPRVKEGKLFFYFDPLSALAPDVQAAWQSEDGRREMVDAAVNAARAAMR